jgi:hypothetical protein
MHACQELSNSRVNRSTLDSRQGALDETTLVQSISVDVDLYDTYWWARHDYLNTRSSFISPERRTRPRSSALDLYTLG